MVFWRSVLWEKSSLKLVAIPDSSKRWMWIHRCIHPLRCPPELFPAVRQDAPTPDSAALRIRIGLFLEPHTVDAEEMVKCKWVHDISQEYLVILVKCISLLFRMGWKKEPTNQALTQYFYVWFDCIHLFINIIDMYGLR